MNLLLVEDEERVADFIQRGLNAEGWTVTAARDGSAALTMVEQDHFDAVILDLMLPTIGGQEVCRRMRSRANPTPVLILTALDSVDDRVAGLRLGADDYLTKPFEFDELIARIEALVRRTHRSGESNKAAAVLRAGPLSFDRRSLDVRCDDRRVEVSVKEREIFKLLISDPGRVFSRERILNSVWSTCADPMTNVVDVYIARLRKKLGPYGNRIKTVRGAGYRIAADDPLDHGTSSRGGA